ncbi:hypothetical protein [Maribacter antarcticus]|uniref:hypothetical protein n=1 Tax=Maribacter antarcticus TaxID=505250 RepID=UPI00047A6E74|nr:hypothetical protein [Maribacter antarcticus]
MIYDKIKNVELWINQGASFENVVSELEVGKSIKSLLFRSFGLNTTPRVLSEKLQIAPLDNKQIASLKQQSFFVKTFGDNKLLGGII